MSFLDLVKERYSVRKFSSKAVEQEKLDSLLEAGIVAPTAHNYQPQRIFVCNSESALALVKTCTPYNFDAPVILLICYDRNISAKRDVDNFDQGIADACIVTTQMMLAVTALGLGSTWVGRFDTVKIKELFQLPENFIPVALLHLGYPAKTSVPNPKHTERFAPDITIFYK